MVKSWHESKTFWVGVIEILIGILGLLATFLGRGVYTPEAIILLVVGALTITLRWLTTEAIM